MSLPLPAHRYDRRIVGWLSLAQLVTWGSVFYTFALLMEPVERELGLTRAQSSLAFSLMLGVDGLLAYPVGRWIDRGHERAVITGGSLLIAIGLVLHTQVSGLFSFYAVWMLLGAGLAASAYNPVFAAVTRRYPLDFRRAIITLTFLGGLASTVFIPLTAWLIEAMGWRAALGVLAVLPIVVCVPIHLRLLRDAPPASPAPSHEVTASRTDEAAERQRLMRSTPYLLVAFFVVTMMGVSAALPAHMVSLLREAGLPSTWVVLVPASIGVIQVVGRLLLFVLERQSDPHAANLVIPLLVPLGLLVLLAAGQSIGLALVFVLLFGLGNGMITIVKGTAVAQYVSRAHVGSLNGAMGVPIALARACAPWLMGLSWTPESGYTAGLWGLVIASVAATLAMWGAQRAARSQA
ncbi:MAG: MFS transporter [Ramlibacter sp.]|jgi:predicted MFS family arabinose efflux permease